MKLNTIMASLALVLANKHNVLSFQVSSGSSFRKSKLVVMKDSERDPAMDAYSAAMARLNQHPVQKVTPPVTKRRPPIIDAELVPGQEPKPAEGPQAPPPETGFQVPKSWEPPARYSPTSAFPKYYKTYVGPENILAWVPINETTAKSNGVRATTEEDKKEDDDYMTMELYDISVDDANNEPTGVSMQEQMDYAVASYLQTNNNMKEKASVPNFAQDEGDPEESENQRDPVTAEADALNNGMASASDESSTAQNNSDDEDLQKEVDHAMEAYYEAMKTMKTLENGPKLDEAVPKTAMEGQTKSKSWQNLKQLLQGGDKQKNEAFQPYPKRLTQNAMHVPFFVDMKEPTVLMMNLDQNQKNKAAGIVATNDINVVQSVLEDKPELSQSIFNSVAEYDDVGVDEEEEQETMESLATSDQEEFGKISTTERLLRKTYLEPGYVRLVLCLLQIYFLAYIANAFLNFLES
jgi:hypothetical protein